MLANIFGTTVFFLHHQSWCHLKKVLLQRLEVDERPSAPPEGKKDVLGPNEKVCAPPHLAQKPV